MKSSCALAGFALALCFSVPGTAQQSSTSSTVSSQSQEQAPAAQQQQPQTDQPSSDGSKKESKIKKKAGDLVPYCVGIGSLGKCRHDADQEEQAKREAAEQELQRQCHDAAAQSQPETSACADLRKSDAAHDVDVGDTYVDQKNYNAAVMRYRSALQTDPTNATAMLHLAQVLEKTKKNAEAYQEYQRFLSTDPQAPDAQKARAALQRLAPYRPAPPTP